MEKLPFTEMCTKLKFYPALRKPDGTYYAKKTLVTMKFGLQKHFLKKSSVNIVNSVDFKARKEVFKSIGAAETGRGIRSETWATFFTRRLNKIYESDTLSLNTAMGLLTRTCFESVYYFCNRGQENLRNFQRGLYSQNRPRREEIRVHDKADRKNHRGDDLTENQTNQARMYEMPGQYILLNENLIHLKIDKKKKTHTHTHNNIGLLK
jgi:hypothetical protein